MIIDIESTAKLAGQLPCHLHVACRSKSVADYCFCTVALAAADSAPDLRVRILAKLKSMTFSVTRLRADGGGLLYFIAIPHQTQ